MRLWGYLSRQSGLFLIVLCLLVILFLGCLDYATGPELASSLFYLVPIAVGAWLVGKWAGAGLSFAAAATWFAADLLTTPGYSSPVTPYWNSAVRLSFFLAFSFVLAALHDLQRRRDELGNFLVHDLRGPLTNVMAALQTLQLPAARDDASMAQELLDLSMVSCRRMVTLTDSILDLGRLEAGKMPLQLESLDMRQVVAASLEQVAAWANQSHIHLVLEVDPEGGTAYADAEMTTRVLVNLLSNAIKVSKAQYQVMVNVAPHGPDRTAVRIADEGPGIPEEWAEKIFEKYGQVEARRGGAAVGSGLGLTFCRLAVEAQGGRIWLERGPHRGTAIVFTLPTRSS